MAFFSLDAFWNRVCSPQGCALFYGHFRCHFLDAFLGVIFQYPFKTSSGLALEALSGPQEAPRRSQEDLRKPRVPSRFAFPSNQRTPRAPREHPREQQEHHRAPVRPFLVLDSLPLRVCLPSGSSMVSKMLSKMISKMLSKMIAGGSSPGRSLSASQLVIRATRAGSIRTNPFTSWIDTFFL